MLKKFPWGQKKYVTCPISTVSQRHVYVPSLERLQLTLEGGDLVELLVELGEPLGHGRRRQAPLERTVTLLVTENNATLRVTDKLVYILYFSFHSPKVG